MSVSSTTKLRAPWHLWVIGIAALLWNAIGVLDFVMTQSKNTTYLAAFTPEQREFFAGFPAWVIAAWALGVFGGLIGSALLLLRKRLAAPAFLASIFGIFITDFQNYVLSDGMKFTGSPGSLVFTATIFIVAVALHLYARAQTKRGVLI